jgi:hypothetical protein
MATACKTRPFTCSFVSVTIEISDARYSVDPIAPGEFGTKAFRLTKRAGGAFGTSVYDTLLRHDGTLVCDCPDFVARHEDNGGRCKHLRALVELGLMTAPTTESVEEIAPSPCCPASELVPCAACVSADPVVQPADAILEKGMALARLEVDRHDDTWDPTEVGPDGQPWVGEPETAEAYDPSPQDETDYRDWQAESVARQHLDASERLTLLELTDRQIEFYRGWNNATGQMFAETLERLAMQIRLTDATTPSELEARAEILDSDVREQWVVTGYEDGRASCEPAGSAWGHGV